MESERPFLLDSAEEVEESRSKEIENNTAEAGMIERNLRTKCMEVAEAGTVEYFFLARIIDLNL